MSAETPWAWAVIDSLGKLSIYVDRARAEQMAAQRGGRVVPLYPG